MLDQNFQNEQIAITTQSEVKPPQNYKPYLYVTIIAFLAVTGLGYYLMPPVQVSYEVQGIPDVATTTQSNNLVQPVISISGTTLSLIESGTIQQSFTLSSEGEFALHVIPSQPPRPFITDQDINFDGYNDLGILTSTGYSGVNYFYDYYLYNSSTKRFDKNNTISGTGILQMDTAKKQISSTYKSGIEYVSDIFTWKENRFIPDRENNLQVNSIFTSSDFKFSFSYPTDWIVKEEQNNSSTSTSISSPDFLRIDAEMDTRIEKGAQIKIANVIPTELTSLDSTINSDEFIVNSPRKNKISVNGAQDAFEYVFRYESSHDNYVVLFIKDGYLWSVIYNSASGSTEDENYRIFKNIVNSIEINEK